MKPQLVRVVVSSKKDLQGSNLPQAGSGNFTQTIHPVVHPRNYFSLQLVNPNTSPTNIVTPSRVFMNSTSPTFNLHDEVLAHKSNNSPINNRVHGVVFSPSSVVNIPINKSGLSEIAPIANTYERVLKRSRNWAEQEAKTFITIWGEYYSKLMSGGSRNAPIYQAMTDDLNELLQGRSLTSTEVKSKIGNLVAEYRRRRKELGRTGGSPSTWPFYEMIDKILGERPYNDDTLLTDSMNTDEQTLQDMPQPDLNSTQISVPVHDSVSSSADINKPQSSTNVNSNTPVESSNVSAVSKVDTPRNKYLSKQKKNKRVSEMRVNLLEDLIGKIDASNESAARCEEKVIEILQQQTEIQQRSADNETEFLNIFKTLVNSMIANRQYHFVKLLIVIFSAYSSSKTFVSL
ncbi:unnamed protein product [Rotaria sp. Silwood1]|nr:unnamed protein product [Rotaria sp. Silwood1]CAF3726995.1 unnamed protein product [Rotaria sp. Silwood1]CAF3768983.1 unnamed protein product [Rotaria sp. Silwood1]CAF3827153.1 unnamed protein product [Rotaria sp. Silwood1]CAF3836913.1 unnamed protein product [Rotaria sp. Silwood1]